MDKYIHGSSPKEQNRLSRLNDILNKECLQQIQIQIQEGMHILDVGSGLGQMTNILAELTGPKGCVVGVERDQNQLARARNIGKNPAQLMFRKGDAYNLPLKINEWGSFDFIHSRFLLEHLKNPQEAVNQMFEASKKGGQIILFDDDHDTLKLTPECRGFQTLWQAYYLTFEKIGNDPYIGRRLFELLKNAGFKQIRNGSVFFGSCADEENFRLYADNLIEVIGMAKDVVISFDLMTAEDFDKNINELTQWSQKPNAAIWYHVCFAAGAK